MKISQNDMMRIKDLMQQGLMTADQANVELVKIGRVKLVTARIPAQVRKALNAAVKAGELAHIAKSGKKPEAYFHPKFEDAMKEARASHERQILNAVLACCGTNPQMREDLAP